MASALKRSIAFLLMLVLAIGMIPTTFAAEIEPTDSTTPDTHATDPPEETTSENTLPVSQTEPETISLQEEEMDYWALDNSIAVFAEAEISGAPNAFANLTLPSGGIDIPAQGYIQHKNILPLYSVYLKNQTGYANNYYVQALSTALIANSTMVKNAMEQYIAAVGGTAMPLTDSFGKTKAENLALGLYLIVETKVPENVVSTTDPFLISLPMTSVNGTNATDGGSRWIYDVTVYPKNQTGDPTLEKTLRESKSDTGKTDAYAHTGTASGGDIVEYQIVSTLPTITSESTYLTTYTFVDTLSKGLSYAKGDVVLEFFTDSACTDSVAKWTEADGKFSVAYNSVETGETMTIAMTQTGLTEINTSKAVYSAADMVNSGYSDLTLRITYAAKLDSDNSVVYGDDGNPNQVNLTWKRTSTDYYDMLADDCHLYTYGIDLTKKFSDGNGDFANVEFVLNNETDNYYVKAALNESEGVYYVTAHVADEADATHFIPVSSGKVVVKGLEDDTYRISEVRTDNGYTLLKEDIEVVISQTETTSLCDDVSGSVEHHLLTASAKVDGNAVTMLADGGSANAEAPLTVVNTRGFDLPETGDNGTMMFTIVGILLMAGAVAVLLIANRKKSE